VGGLDRVFVLTGRLRERVRERHGIGLTVLRIETRVELEASPLPGE